MARRALVREPEHWISTMFSYRPNKWRKEMWLSNIVRLTIWFEISIPQALQGENFLKFHNTILGCWVTQEEQGIQMRTQRAMRARMKDMLVISMNAYFQNSITTTPPRTSSSSVWPLQQIYNFYLSYYPKSYTPEHQNSCNIQPEDLVCPLKNHCYAIKWISQVKKSWRYKLLESCRLTATASTVATVDLLAGIATNAAIKQMAGYIIFT